MNATRSRMPTQFPRNEATRAVPSASPPSPLWARGYPSIMVGTAAGVPGMLMSTAVIEPPKTLAV